MKLTKHIQRRRREPGEFPTPMAAIRNHCLECVGYVGTEVERCTAPECWLYPWRFGMRPDRATRLGHTADFPADRPQAIPRDSAQPSPAGRAVGPARPELTPCGAQNAHEGD